MSTQEKHTEQRTQLRAQQKAQLRQDILDVARDIADQDGWQAVTIRKIADKIAYSVPTIYEHFESKETLLIELMRDGFRLLADALREVPPGEDPEMRLVAVATAYWNFAFQNPAFYQVMHELGGVTFGTPQTPPAALEAFDVLSKAVQAAVPGGAVFAEMDNEVERLWATLHGYISLTMAGRIIGGRERAAGLVAPAVRQMIAGWHSAASANELISANESTLVMHSTRKETSL